LTSDDWLELFDWMPAGRGVGPTPAQTRASAARDTERAVSQQNVEIVERAIAAVNARDVDAYLACCTENVRMQTPFAPIGATYDGRKAIHRFFDDIADTAPDFRITVDSAEPLGSDQVLASLRVSATFRASGIPTGRPTTNVYDFDAGRIARVRIFFDRQDALKAVGLEA
jgi:ketosteroid isomerase-like protein